MTDADPAGPRDRLERAILGEEVVFNAQEVSEETGVTIEETRRLWRALGFPEHGTETAFTRADAEAVSTLVEVVSSGLIDFDLAVNLTRAVGQTMARLADWEVASLVQRVEELEAGDQATGSRVGSAMRIVEGFNEPFEQLMLYAWRRPRAAARARGEARGANEEDLHTTQITVGFADIVNYTALSNQMSEARIGDLVELFESRCADVVAAQRGRVIKSIGDAVLFVNDDPIRALAPRGHRVMDERAGPQPPRRGSRSRLPVAPAGRAGAGHRAPRRGSRRSRPPSPRRARRRGPSGRCRRPGDSA